MRRTSRSRSKRGSGASPRGKRLVDVSFGRGEAPSKSQFGVELTSRSRKGVRRKDWPVRRQRRKCDESLGGALGAVRFVRAVVAVGLAVAEGIERKALGAAMERVLAAVAIQLVGAVAAVGVAVAQLLRWHVV